MILQFMFTPLLIGSSFATSLLAGQFFTDMRMQSQRLQKGAANSFFKRKRGVIYRLALFSLFTDWLAMFSLLWYVIEGIDILLGLFVSVCQAIVAIYYIRSTLKFLRSSIILLTSAGSKTDSTALNALRRMARWLFFSAILMIFMTLSMMIFATSGYLWYGIWAPNGWVLGWVLALCIRVGVSFTQVMMSRPRTKKKNATNMVANSSTKKKGSITADGSTTGSFAGSFSASMVTSEANGASASFVGTSSASSPGSQNSRRHVSNVNSAAENAIFLSSTGESNGSSSK